MKKILVLFLCLCTSVVFSQNVHKSLIRSHTKSMSNVYLIVLVESNSLVYVVDSISTACNYFTSTAILKVIDSQPNEEGYYIVENYEPGIDYWFVKVYDESIKMYVISNPIREAHI